MPDLNALNFPIEFLRIIVLQPFKLYSKHATVFLSFDKPKKSSVVVNHIAFVLFIKKKYLCNEIKTIISIISGNPYCVNIKGRINYFTIITLVA